MTSVEIVMFGYFFLNDEIIIWYSSFVYVLCISFSILLEPDCIGRSRYW